MSNAGTKSNQLTIAERQRHRGSRSEPARDGTLARLDAAERQARGTGRQPAFGKESSKSACGSATRTPHPGPSPRGQSASFGISRSFSKFAVLIESARRAFCGAKVAKWPFALHTQISGT